MCLYYIIVLQISAGLITLGLAHVYQSVNDSLRGVSNEVEVKILQHLGSVPGSVAVSVVAVSHGASVGSCNQ